MYWLFITSSFPACLSHNQTFARILVLLQTCSSGYEMFCLVQNVWLRVLAWPVLHTHY